MKIMKHSILVGVAAIALSAVGTAEAGRGGSDSRIQNAVNTGSSDAIIAELERAERLVCASCIDTVMALLDDERYEVREAAAWWFARRPVQKKALTEASLADLASSDPVRVRNAADILGTFRHPGAVSALTAAVQRGGLTAEARQHVVRAIGTIGHQAGNPALAAAMSDADATVRLEAVTSWSKVRWQDGAAPVAALVADSDLTVRRKAAAVVGELREASARAALEAQLLGDADPAVRRNAAWALGRIGDAASRAALQQATEDASGLVRRTAAQALGRLR